jgi:hypothetical protein
MTLIIALTRHTIPLAFLGSEAPQSGETIALAATLLVLGASFFITDGAQTVAGGALRGLNDTRVPLVFSALSFWAVGFVSSYWLAFPMGLGAIGVWIGLSLGTAVYAALLVWRFHLLTARHYLPAVVIRMGMISVSDQSKADHLWTRHDRRLSQPHGGTACHCSSAGAATASRTHPRARPVPYALAGETAEVDAWPGHPTGAA